MSRDVQKLTWFSIHLKFGMYGDCTEVHCTALTTGKKDQLMCTFLEMILKESGSAVLLRIALVSGGVDLTAPVHLCSMLFATNF